MRLKPLSALRSRKLRGAIVVSAAVVGFAGLAIAQTTPALADPTETLVVVGSDTIQDVYNAFSTNSGGNFIGSYNATNPVTNQINEIITPVDGTSGVNCSFARPDGSSQGVAALRYSLNEASTNLGTNLIAPGPQLGCVDISRSSSGPGSLGNYTGSGAIQYIPFALDALSAATGPASCTTATPCPTYAADLQNGNTLTVTTVPTAISTANDFTINDLEAMYDHCTDVTEGGVTYWPYQTGTGSTPQPANTQQIDLYLPQPGSGTLSFWASTLGFTSTAPPICDHQTIVNGPLASANDGGVTVAVEENDGTAVTTDADGYFPFSIAQWISQTNGHDNRLHGAVLNDLAPCTNSTTCGAEVSPFNASGGLNTSFPITRDVYSVVSLARVTNSSDPLDKLLNGSSSTVCNEKSTIISYGFALLGSACGEIIPADEAQP
jgi:hypothetical protein